jgi:hypothetical protein
VEALGARENPTDLATTVATAVKIRVPSFNVEPEGDDFFTGEATSPSGSSLNDSIAPQS